MADRRFESTFFTDPTDEPGLVLGADGVVYIVKPDGTRVAAGGGGGSLPAQWSVDEFGNLRIISGGRNANAASPWPWDISGILIYPSSDSPANESVVQFVDPDTGHDVFELTKAGAVKIGDGFAIELNEDGTASFNGQVAVDSFNCGGDSVIAGTLFLYRASAPADGDLAFPSVATFWIDATPSAAKLMVKGKDSNGTIVVGEVVLS
jgi:hypothetical protein